MAGARPAHCVQGQTRPRVLGAHERGERSSPIPAGRLGLGGWVETPTATADSLTVMSGGSRAAPWRVVDGPERTTGAGVDGEAWAFTLERGGTRRPLIVVVSRRALDADPAQRMPTRTREAIATRGRSEAETAAWTDDPPPCLMLGRSGYLNPPPSLLQQPGT